jgi:N-acetylmuramic acid 6-phosphate (MurNAc-6-P) etherase
MRASIAIALLSFATISIDAADRVRAGKWETSLTMGAGKPTVSTYCITASEAKLMNGDLAAMRKYVEESTAKNTKGRCAVQSVELNGNRTVVTIACGKTKVTGTTIYHGDRYEYSSSNGMTMTGKRTGACP